MQSTIVILIMITMIVLLLFIGAPIKPARLLAKGIVKFGIGLLLLFFTNVFGGMVGLYIPINLFTVSISAILGIFGITSLAAIHIFIL